MIQTNIRDCCERIEKQFGMPSRWDSANGLEFLSNGAPFTPDNLAVIETAMGAWKKLALSVSGQTVTVTSDADVLEVVLLIGAEEFTLPLFDGVGVLGIEFPEGVLSRKISAKNKAVFGYSEATVYA